MPPQGVSGELAPAQVEVRVLASGSLDIDPVGVALPPAELPAPGARGGPSLKLRVTNISPVPLRLSMKLAAISPALADAVLVRASGAGAVLADGPLRDTERGTLPVGLLSSGETTTVRMRFKLKAGLPDDAYRGRLDIRQLEFDGVPLTEPAEGDEQPDPAATTPVPDASATTPAADPSATTPASATPGATSPTSTTP